MTIFGSFVHVPFQLQPNQLEEYRSPGPEPKIHRTLGCFPFLDTQLTHTSNLDSNRERTNNEGDVRERDLGDITATRASGHISPSP